MVSEHIMSTGSSAPPQQGAAARDGPLISLHASVLPGSETSCCAYSMLHAGDALCSLGMLHAPWWVCSTGTCLLLILFNLSFLPLVCHLPKQLGPILHLKFQLLSKQPSRCARASIISQGVQSWLSGMHSSVACTAQVHVACDVHGRMMHGSGLTRGAQARVASLEAWCAGARREA